MITSSMSTPHIPNTLIINSSTLSGNNANYEGGGIYIADDDEPIMLKNTIVAGNSAPVAADIRGEVNSLDYNLIQDLSGAVITGSTAHNIYNQDPRLGPLQSNGGDTLTMALLTGSPARNKIPQSAGGGGYNGCPTLDQRRYFRDTVRDIGAYEVSDIIGLLGDLVWSDNNNDGIQNGGEPGIPGVTVNLFDRDGTVQDTTSTDEHGHYSFGILQPGSYFVEFQLPDGYSFSPPDQGSNDRYDSDADPNTGRTPVTTINLGDSQVRWDAGMYNPLYVDLISFTAEQRSNHVVLRWETAVEINILGFNLIRQSFDQQGELGAAITLNDHVIPGQGSSISGARYEYLDRKVLPGHMYRYDLRAVNTDGTSDLLGSVLIYFSE